MVNDEINSLCETESKELPDGGLDTDTLICMNVIKQKGTEHLVKFTIVPAEVDAEFPEEPIRYFAKISKKTKQKKL